MVAMITAIGMWLLALPVGAAILLGAILAPTDPVLASGVQSEPGSKPDRLGFSLGGEGGLNDGAAYPFVTLGLGLLGVRELGPGLAHWWSVDLVWATLGGVGIGAALGAATGRLVVYLRSSHGEAIGLDEFLGLGLVGLAYGLAQVSLASGFLAVFAAGLALQRVREPSRAGMWPPDVRARVQDTLDSPSHHARDMRDSVQAFNERLEKLGVAVDVVRVRALPHRSVFGASSRLAPFGRCDREMRWMRTGSRSCSGRSTYCSPGSRHRSWLLDRCCETGARSSRAGVPTRQPDRDSIGWCPERALIGSAPRDFCTTEAGNVRARQARGPARALAYRRQPAQLPHSGLH